MEIYVIILIIIAALLLGLFILAAVANTVAFGKRYDKVKLFKYFSAADFSLESEGISFGKLSGAIYENKAVAKKDGIVIFVHGLGPGHAAYMTEIAYLCGLGYKVIAVDSLGCGDSSGKNIRGMYEGVRTAVQTVDFVKKNFADSKIYLVGHSWGGYSALCAAAEREIDGVVAISAPNTPVKTISDGASAFIGRPLAAILQPFLYVINFFKFGAKGNVNAAKRIEKSGTRALLIHGNCDKVVKKHNAAAYKAKGENIKVYISEGKAHNPYITFAAEQKLTELKTAIRNSRKMTEEEQKEYFGNFDFAAATAEDVEVMGKIAEFLSE